MEMGVMRASIGKTAGAATSRSSAGTRNRVITAIFCAITGVPAFVRPKEFLAALAFLGL